MPFPILPFDISCVIRRTFKIDVLYNVLGHPDVKKWKLWCERACEIKKILWTKGPIEEKMINYHFKELYKTVYYKTHFMKSVRIRSFYRPYSVKILENTDQINSEYRHFLRSVKSNISQFFFFDWALYECFFSFLVKAFVNFEKLVRFHRQAFIVYKNGEILKILLDIFCQKLVVSNVILAFLGHMKPKIFFVGQPWCPT